MESHKKFRAALKLPFSLLSDADGQVIRLYDAVSQRKNQVLAARKIVLIDREGRITYRDDAYDLSSDADLERLKRAVRRLR